MLEINQGLLILLVVLGCLFGMGMGFILGLNYLGKGQREEA